MKLATVVFMTTLALLTPLGGRAEILWRGNFESGDLSQWSGTLVPSTGSRQNIVVVDSPVFEGRRAAAVTIHPDDMFPNGHNRVELRYEGKRTGEGQTTFFAWRFRLLANVQVHEDLGYWETKGPEYRQSMAFYLDPVKQGTAIGFRTNLPAPRQHWNAPLKAGEWHQLTMQILWSNDPEKGRVSVWFDGANVVSNAAAQTKPNAADLFLQTGFHRDSSQAPVETLYLDDAVEGTSLDDVLSPARKADTNTN